MPPDPLAGLSDKAALDALHDRLFNDVEQPEGRRFERLTAVVMAAIGEPFVRHDVVESGAGRRAAHQIDVWIERAGREELVVVEVKHWSRVVGQEVLDALVGVRDQLRAVEAVAVSVEGFTRGAMNVAADEGVRLVRLRPIRDQRNWHGVLREIRMRGRFAAPIVEELTFRAAEPADVRRRFPEGLPVAVSDELVFELEDGTPGERLLELLAQRTSSNDEGEYEHSVEVPTGRFLRVNDSDRVAIRAVEWRERVVVANTEHFIGPPSDGLVLVEELAIDAEEDPRRRVLMDHQLRAWTIDADGVVHAT